MSVTCKLWLVPGGAPREQQIDLSWRLGTGQIVAIVTGLGANQHLGGEQDRGAA
jgi:hypothetical protein